jgi:hypothetical protein
VGGKDWERPVKRSVAIHTSKADRFLLLLDFGYLREATAAIQELLVALKKVALVSGWSPTTAGSVTRYIYSKPQELVLGADFVRPHVSDKIMCPFLGG